MEETQPRVTGRLRGLRVLCILPSLELGGAERQAVLLARHLMNDEHADVQVWGFGEPGLLPRLVDNAGLEWRAIPLPPPGARIRQLYGLIGFVRALRRARPDVLLPYSRVPNRLCGLFWRWTGARLCVWNYREGAPVSEPLRVDRWAFRRTPVIVANSRHGAESLARTYGRTAADIRVIRNGIELAPPQASPGEWRRRLDVNRHAFVSCMVANLTSNKDHATLLRAWRIVVNRLEVGGRSAVLVLPGTFGDTSEAIRRLIEDLNLHSHVRLLGQVTDISGLLQAVDLGVFSSVREGSPNGVLECMAAGLAVAGTDIDGIREAIGPNGVAYLAPPRDAERLADLIVSFANDPERRAALGRLNRRRIEECYSTEQMARNMAALCAAHLA